LSTVVWAPYADASTFYRLTEPARVTGTRVVERLPAVGDADTVVLNRPLDPGVAEQIRLWRREGRQVVVDLDDCFDTVSVNHAIHGIYTTEHLHAACRAASVVTCSTPAIAERYGYGHGEVLRNRVPYAQTQTVAARRREPVPWVGWYGSLASHPDDPAAAGAGVGAALNGTPARFAFIGPERDNVPLTQCFELDRDVIGLGYTSMNALPRLVAEFDVGIVPLDLSPFNEAKSWLKGLEMAAVGVPVIASPTSEYLLAAEQGGCWIAENHADWFSLLTLLLTDESARADQAASGRAWALANTYERYADDWRSVWYSREHATT
jgi:hypothetical protein